MSPEPGHPRVVSTALALLVPAALVLAACGAQDPDDDAAGAPSGTSSSGSSPSDSGSSAVALDQVPAGPAEDVPSALDDMDNESFPQPLIDPDEVISGGPPSDGIPAIDEPKFQKAGDIDWMDDAEGVLAVTIDGETRGYPMQVLMWHEIVNDTVNGVPIAATYCPLCNSGMAFIREVDERVLSFGTSGRLYLSNLVMYDRQTESLWPQLTGAASMGVLTGEKLEVIPMTPVAWSDFRKAHPDAWVLSRDTGFDRAYGVNPYTDYDNPDTPVLFDPGVSDDRLEYKERIIVLMGETETVTVPRSAVAKTGVLEFTVDDRDLVAFYLKGQASSLDAGTVSGGQEIGSVAVYEPAIDGQRLTFQAEGEGFVDDQTRTTWNILGEATAGPHKGGTLTPFEFTDTFWFAWVAFQPDTRVVTS